MMKMKTLGQVAYEAYCVAVNGLSYTGVVLPKWEGTTDNIRAAWEVAAIAVAKEISKDCDVECINSQYCIDLSFEGE